MKLTYLSLVLGLAAGCTSSGPSDQIVTGRVDTNFPTAVTGVRAVRNGAVVATASLAADRSFEMKIPAGSGTQLELVGASKSQLVFPRHTGTMAKFNVRAGGTAFDFGSLHYVGDATTTTIVFHDGTADAECDDHGHDASGAVCADDSDDDNGTCEADDDANETETGDDATDDSPQDLADDGDAVADHNFPADGCADDDGADDAADDNGGGSGSDD